MREYQLSGFKQVEGVADNMIAYVSGDGSFDASNKALVVVDAQGEILAKGLR